MDFVDLLLRTFDAARRATDELRSQSCMLPLPGLLQDKATRSRSTLILRLFLFGLASATLSTADNRFLPCLFGLACTSNEDELPQPLEASRKAYLQQFLALDLECARNGISSCAARDTSEQIKTTSSFSF